MTAEMSREDKLALTIAAIEKSAGKGSIIYRNHLPDIEYISSGCPSVDAALGGGWARGRVVEIYGPESTGKTTLALHAIAEVQKLGEIAAIVDMEHALDPHYMSNLGIDLDAIPTSQPDYGEQALDIVQGLVESGAISLVVLDSVAALVPKAELEGTMEDNQMGLQSRLMSKALRKLVGLASQTKTTIMFINQIRMKIGVMWGNPETTSGGNALKFYASQRVDVRKGKTVQGADDLASANITKVKVVKNKLAPPFREAEFEIEYGKGINVMKDLVVLASNIGVIDKSGSWYAYQGTRLGQGVENVMKSLLDNPELFTTIRGATLEFIRKS